MFFTIFQIGRSVAGQVGLEIDRVSSPSISPSSSFSSSSYDYSSSSYDYSSSINDRSSDEDGKKEKSTGRILRIGSSRTTNGLIIQSGLILASGTAAGWSFGIVSRPFERVREVVHLARSGNRVEGRGGVGGRGGEVERGERGMRDLLREARMREGSWSKVLFSPAVIVDRITASPTQTSREGRWRRALMRSGNAPIYSVRYFAFALVSGDLE